jgi:DNA-binding FrmR family transcriptional regulator
MEMSARINRIVGQLRGIQKMAENGRECSDVLQQVSAVKKAIDALTKDLVIDSLSAKKSPEERKKIEQVVSRVLRI